MRSPRTPSTSSIVARMMALTSDMAATVADFQQRNKNSWKSAVVIVMEHERSGGVPKLLAYQASNSLRYIAITSPVAGHGTGTHPGPASDPAKARNAAGKSNQPSL